MARTAGEIALVSGTGGTTNCADPIRPERVPRRLLDRSSQDKLGNQLRCWDRLALCNFLNSPTPAHCRGEWRCPAGRGPYSLLSVIRIKVRAFSLFFLVIMILYSVPLMRAA